MVATQIGTAGVWHETTEIHPLFGCRTSRFFSVMIKTEWAGGGGEVWTFGGPSDLLSVLAFVLKLDEEVVTDLAVFAT